MSRLRDRLNSSKITFASIRKAKKMTFFWDPPVDYVDDCWVCRVPITEVQKNEAGVDVQVVYFKRFVSPGIGVDYFSSFRGWVKKNFNTIPDDMILWDLGMAIPNKVTQFTKHHVCGKLKGRDDWKTNFQLQKEVYCGIVDHSDYGRKILQLTSGTWDKVTEVISRQFEQFGDSGDPELTPGCYSFTAEYCEETNDPNKKYTVYKNEVIKPDEKMMGILTSPNDVNIAKIIYKDHFDAIKETVLKYVVNCDWDFSDIDESKRTTLEDIEEIPATAPATKTAVQMAAEQFPGQVTSAPIEPAPVAPAPVAPAPVAPAPVAPAPVAPAPVAPAPVAPAPVAPAPVAPAPVAPAPVAPAPVAPAPVAPVPVAPAPVAPAPVAPAPVAPAPVAPAPVAPAPVAPAPVAPAPVAPAPVTPAPVASTAELVPCLHCGGGIDVEQNIDNCPHCNKSIFPE